MNNTTVDIENLVQKINDEKARLLLPATVYISVLMVIGLAGNLMVCFYYGFKTKSIPASIFIVTLAVYDLTVCLISMPTEIVDIEKFYTFENGPACKFLRFISYFAAVGSILTLITIAIDRFRHIRRATKNQMTVRDAKKYSIIVVGIAVLSSWPTLVIYDSVKVPIPNSFNLDLKGFDCTSTKEKSYRPFVWTFNLVHFLGFFICTAILSVLYGKVGRTIYTQRKRILTYKRCATYKMSNSQTSSFVEVNSNIQSDNSTQSTQFESNTQSDSNAQSQNMNENCNTSTSKESSNDKGCVSSDHSQDIPKRNHVEKMEKRKIKPIVQSNNQAQRNFDIETVKITLLMIAVTVLFIVSLLPYLSLTIWRVYKGKHEAEFLTDTGLVAFKIGSRSYLLNSSLNPWIYGIFNSRFRQYYYQKVCCKSV